MKNIKFIILILVCLILYLIGYFVCLCAINVFLNKDGIRCAINKVVKLTRMSIKSRLINEKVLPTNEFQRIIACMKVLSHAKLPIILNENRVVGVNQLNQKDFIEIQGIKIEDNKISLRYKCPFNETKALAKTKTYLCIDEIKYSKVEMIDENIIINEINTWNLYDDTQVILHTKYKKGNEADIEIKFKDDICLDKIHINDIMAVANYGGYVGLIFVIWTCISFIIALLLKDILTIMALCVGVISMFLAFKVNVRWYKVIKQFIEK